MMSASEAAREREAIPRTRRGRRRRRRRRRPRRATCEEEECGGEGEEEEEGFATRATTTAGAMIDVRQMSAKRAVEVAMAMKRRGSESDADYDDNLNGFIYCHMALHPSPPHSPLLSWWCWLAVCAREVRGALLRCVIFTHFAFYGLIGGIY